MTICQLNVYLTNGESKRRRREAATGVGEHHVTKRSQIILILPSSPETWLEV